MDAPKHQQLLSETREHISHLEEAIAQINAVRKGLKENAIEVKSQISAVFGRQLECLRSRELWLQGQVELVEHAKESVLRRQQDQLCQLLGSLSTSLAYSQDDEGTDLDKKLKETLDRLDGMDLKPEESSNIGFRADLTGLRQAIRSFGRVDSKGLPMENAFVGPETTSSCLPRAYEDYGEPEHLLLYKTVEELKRGRGEANKVNVCVPRLGNESRKPWLSYSLSENSLDHLAASGDSDTAAAGRFNQASFGRNQPGRYSLKSEHSIQHWLHQIKGQVENEEDEFEIISQPRAHTVSTSSESIEFVPDIQEPKPETSQLKVFSNVMDSPLKNWLNSHPNVEATSSKDVPTMALTKLDDWEQWLIKKPSSATEKSTGCCGGTCSDPSSPIVDIESLDTLQCKDPNYWSKANNNKEWLSIAEKSTVERFMAENEEKDVDEMEWTAISASAIKGCRANEPCVAITDCVCEELCCGPINSNVEEFVDNSADQSQPMESDDKSIETWLNRPSSLNDGPTADYDQSSHLFPVFHETKSSNQWLAQPNRAIQPSKTSRDVKWVKSTDSQNEVHYDSFPGFKNAHNKEEMKKWIMCQEVVATSPPTQIQETLKHMESIVSATPTHWLSGYKPEVRAPTPAAPLTWLKKTESCISTDSLCLSEAEIMNGLEKLSLAWNESLKDKSLGGKLPVVDNFKSWLSNCDNIAKENVNVMKSQECYSKDWLARNACEEEDDSQWLLRKENTPSSSPVRSADKLDGLFPCFQSKELLGKWLLAQSKSTEQS